MSSFFYKGIALDLTSCFIIFIRGDAVDELFTIGRFADVAGVTLRTLRYYDKIGLLKPCSYNNSGHRLYDRKDFASLQKIMTLKFIGLSLDEISNIIKYDTADLDFKKSLEIQSKIIEEKIHHMNMIRNSIEDAIHIVNETDGDNWGKFIKIINIINLDSRWLEQYENASNLRARIKIHELYSTNKIGWMEWYFDKLDIKSNAKILEIGCGDGAFWYKNSKRIPKNWEITLTDFSDGMLREAQKFLDKNSQNFDFKKVDAENITYNDETFDVVIANHVLSQVSNIEKAISEISRVTKINGAFYASTVGKSHMKEMRELLNRIKMDEISTEGWNLMGKFQLENGMELISKYFDCVSVERYVDNLVVKDAGPLIDYIFSMPGNIKQMFGENKLNGLLNFIEKHIIENSGIYITKDTGFFKGLKKERRNFHDK